MLSRRHRSKFLVTQLFCDLAGVAGGLVLAYWLRFESGLDADAVVATDYAAQFAWALPLWMVALSWTRCYRNSPIIADLNRMRRIVMGSLLAVALVVTRNYFWRVEDVSRGLYPMALISVVACVMVARVVGQSLITSIFVRRPDFRSRAAIVGTGELARQLGFRIQRHPEYAYELVCHIPVGEGAGDSVGGIPVKGLLSGLREVLSAQDIDEVFITETEVSVEEMERVFLDAEREGARVHVVPSLFDIVRSRIRSAEIDGVPIYTLQETPLTGWNVFVKRVFDLVAAGVGLLMLSPLLAAVYLLVRRSIPGVDPIYRQDRLGLDGRTFQCLKFRTMPPTAESTGPVFGAQVDPRATRLGNMLRKWNIDELPQLWNVVRGDMSLVGPRPERPFFVERFRERVPRYMARHAVKAGITGWAQVHGLRGNDTSLSERIRYDLYYIENWSLLLDIKIIVMTFFRPSQSVSAAAGDTFASLFDEAEDKAGGGAPPPTVGGTGAGGGVRPSA